MEQVVFIYSGRLEAVAEEVAEVTWGRPRPGASQELAAGAEHGVCPGPWGSRELLADQHHLEMSAESERAIAANRAAGRGFDYWIPPPGTAG